MEILVSNRGDPPIFPLGGRPPLPPSPPYHPVVSLTPSSIYCRQSSPLLSFSSIGAGPFDLISASTLPQLFQLTARELVSSSSEVRSPFKTYAISDDSLEQYRWQNDYLTPI
ncbi:hypothetical protein QYF36_008177 [Acer negundo]|nr:hypothetical protein QYF36_008177 [Acer negundo]